MKTQKYLLEIEKELSHTIREKIKSGAGVSEQGLLSTSLDYLKRLYTGVPVKTVIPTRTFCWKSSDLNSVVKIWEEIKPEIEKHIFQIKNKPEIFGEQLILDADDNIIGKEENLLVIVRYKNFEPRIMTIKFVLANMLYILTPKQQKVLRTMT